MPKVNQKKSQSASQREEAHVKSEGMASGSQRRRRKRDDPTDDDEEGGTSSQAKNTLSKSEMDRKVADFVRYMLFMDAKKTAVKRTDLNKNVLKEHTRLFVPVFTEAKKQIKKTFGYELVEAETKTKQKVYLLLNKMQEEGQQVVESTPEETTRMGLLMVILALIFMQDNFLTEELLWQTLERLGVVKGEIHETFGDADKLITNEFVKQMYLDRKKVVTGDTAVFEYRWGLRAEHEITKRQVLEFVAKVYGTEVQAWTAKYKEVVDEEEGDSGSD